MNRPVVSVDLDDVVWSFTTPLLTHYNLVYDDCVHIEDITEWDIHKFLKPQCKNVFKEFCTEGFFEKLIIPQSTVDWLTVLNMISDLKFVSACYSSTVPLRSKTLNHYLPFFKDEMLIKLSDKSLIRTDYFIDDNEDNCNAVWDTNRTRVYMVNKPWNSQRGYSTNEALAKVVIDILKGDYYMKGV